MLILGIALLVLYLALFPILRRVTGELASRNRRLREHALERGSLLEAERAARAEAESIQRLLAEQNERLRELDQMKDEFVSLVSHELRTPLTSIRGYLELFRDSGDLTPKQREFLKVVDRNSQRLLELVGDLLFLAKVDAGASRSTATRWISRRSWRNRSRRAARWRRARKIELVASVGPPPARRRPGAPGPSPRQPGLERAQVHRHRRSGGGAPVADDGHVLPRGQGHRARDPDPEEQPLLFERFFRSSRATENAIPGTGLGLAITKAIVERHGGWIETRE